jgi:hypothetical protein
MIEASLVQVDALAAVCHTAMDGELTTFQAVVSSVAELVHRRSPSNTSHAEVVGELAIKYQKMEDRCSRLERPTMTCSLGHRPVRPDWPIV